ncbi:hypothetical protein AC579_7738 [Pseudocercospora musae]|uniref:PhoD-like phosphatase domain-containing protein n=1 Tax=Pseudocercospora musae TaxID=113226 RepID=A0A139IK30_9PEZI|nr:hypothetical protein AC579_7738 [Pseudocercospora musae]
MSDRRQSGLWTRNPDTGFYEQLPLPQAQISAAGPYQPHISPSRPYQYYQPPLRVSQTQSQSQKQDARRSFSDRSGIPNPEAGAGKSRKGRSNTLDATSDDSARTQHVNSTSAPGSSHQKPLTVDPDYVPNNIRSTAWSPDPMSPRTMAQPQIQKQSQSQTQRKQNVKGRQISNASNASETVRRGSVPDRSPLQNLESWSKEEKRARVAQAEERVRQRSVSGQTGERDLSEHQASLRSGQGRVVSDPLARSNGQTTASRSASAYRAENAAQRFRQASDALKTESSPKSPKVQQPPPATANQSRAYDRRSESVRQPDAEQSPRGSTDLARSGSRKYRARDAGFAGGAAAAAAAPTISNYNGAAERGKAAYERRKGQPQVERSPVSPISPDLSETAQPTGHRTAQIPERRIAPEEAQRRVAAPEAKKHHLHLNPFHRSHEHRAYELNSQPLEEWKQARAARLTAEDIDLDSVFAGAKDAKDAWWEKPRRSSSSSKRAPPNLSQTDGPYEETANGFQPRLFLKCGPLLRYTGIKRETVQTRTGSSRPSTAREREVWRGSIMIVTEDDQSDLQSAPTLRLFAQPMDLHQAPPQHLLQSGHELSPEFEDPVAGQVKLSRTGRALYVRPVAEIDGDVDLSREENNHGLYSASRTPILGPQNSIGPDGRQFQHITFQDKSRIKSRDGEKAGRYRETSAIRLHGERGHTFWRFNVEIELTSRQTRVAYRVNQGPAIGFWVPARAETMNIMFHSCNGFSYTVDSNKFSGPDPLWRDVLNRHQSKPFHVMIGGGDQIYNDAAMHQTTLFKEYLHIKNPQAKHEADFTAEMQDELEDFYLHRYAMWFSQGFFGMANSQIPMVNIWDDHDIIDGYGSYPHSFMSTRVFSGLGAIAFKYYMLFQHQSVVAETERDEPSWLLGTSPGPYIQERSRSLIMSLGRKITFLGLDCRTERMREEILSQETYDIVFDRLRTEIVKDETKHLVVLLGVPIAYPRLNFLENMLTSRMMDPIKAIGRTGALGGFVNKFDGGVEILDDLDDHWTAKHHKQERNWFIQELQDLAAEKSVRVTILGGDVHLGAVGQFFSNQKLGIAKDKDHRYMPNVISSAIVNTPPPTMMADVLNKRNKIHHLDEETDENMIPMFSHDVDGSKRNNNHLLPRRNFCIISEYLPGSTPPGTPLPQHTQDQPPARYFDGNSDEKPKDRRFPPGSMNRTMSLTRGPMNLVRRLSGSSKKGPPPISLAPEQTRPVNDDDRRPSSTIQRSNSLSAADRAAEPSSRFSGSSPQNAEFERPTFKRRPTNFSEKDARRASKAAGQTDGAADAGFGHIDLEGGLDISLCMEVNQHDPAGVTVPYRLLVPALSYQGPGDPNPARFSSHRKSLMDRLRLNRKREAYVDGAQHDNADNYTEYRGSSQGSRTPSPPPAKPDEFDPATEKNTNMNANPNLGYRAGGQPHHESYNKGLSLASPPIGSAHQVSTGGLKSHHPTGAGAEFPDSGYRRVSAPAPYRGPYGRNNDDGFSDGSFSDDDESYIQTAPPQRRPSKVPRFFGIGGGKKLRKSVDIGDREGELEDLGRTASGNQKPGWKIWR